MGPVEVIILGRTGDGDAFKFGFSPSWVFFSFAPPS